MELRDNPQPKFIPDQDLKLMDQVRQVLRYHHYSYRTEQAYCNWIIRFIKYHRGKTYPSKMEKQKLESFLSHLATKQKVSAATQRQAMNSLIFLYQRALDKRVEGKIEPVKAKKHKALPVVMTKDAVRTVFSYMHGKHKMIAGLLYGGGLRLMECTRLRINDLDFARDQIYIRGSKGAKDRTKLFPQSIKEQLRVQVDQLNVLHDEDLVQGYGETNIPLSLMRKYPSASREFIWQFVFQSKKLSRDSRSGVLRRHHTFESGLQKAVRKAVLQSGITKRVSCHTFCNPFIGK